METSEIHQIVERKFKTHTIRFILGDCKDWMRLPDLDAYDVAIVDPPYGIGDAWSKSRRDQFYRHKSTYKNDQSEKPDKEYFDLLMDCSKNQIVWGWNYYCHLLPEGNNIIIWDKVRDFTKTFMSEAELAWSSFSQPVRIYTHQWDGGKKKSETGMKKIHPFQKPIKLYEWLLLNYAGPKQRVLDTHGGSGSIAIACHKHRVSLDIVERDPDYHKAMIDRFDNQEVFRRVEKDGEERMHIQTNLLDEIDD